MIYDITRRVTPKTAVWPGDTPFGFDLLTSIAGGGSVNLTTLHMSAHTGTHADAYWHFENDGAHPAEMPLEAYIGPAQVVTLTREDGGITPDDLRDLEIAQATRVLFHTPVSDLPDHVWPTRFPYLTIELIDMLAAQGVRLIGLDSPSVDAFHSKDLTCHHRLRARGIVNLESLQLSGVPDEVYELVALPLKLDGVCGSPVRAILREIL